MHAPRFDRLARLRPPGISLSGTGPVARRRLLAALGLAGLAVPSVVRAQSEESTEAACEACRLLGITGGGVIRLASGDANLVVFASRSINDAAPPTGVVRWMDPNHEGGVLMENVGAVLYADVEDDPRARELRGLLRVNGVGEEPFVLLVSDIGGDEGESRDRCRLVAGDAVSGTTASGWSYEAEGELIGGDLALLQDGDEG